MLLTLFESLCYPGFMPSPYRIPDPPPVKPVPKTPFSTKVRDFLQRYNPVGLNNVVVTIWFAIASLCCFLTYTIVQGIKRDLSAQKVIDYAMVKNQGTIDSCSHSRDFVTCICYTRNGRVTVVASPSREKPVYYSQAN